MALPDGFQAQIISGGLQGHAVRPDLTRFGEYGRLLESRAHIYLTKELVPPGSVELSLKYRQNLPDFYDSRSLTNQ